MVTHNLTVRRYRPDDEIRILETFNLVFRAECGPGFVDRDLATWRWQFLDNPAGHQIFLAVDEDGTVAAQYTAIPQLVDTAHGPQRFVHIVDSMTHPEYRQGLQRLGVFATLGQAFTAYYREHGNEIGYGFPVRAAERIGRRLLGYELLRPIDYLLRAATDAAPAIASDLRVARVRSLTAEVDDLWRRSLPPMPCATRRDLRYLQWRYERGPTARRDYELHAVRRQGELVGLLVLRPRHELVPGSCSIVDWICHEDDRDAATALLATACARAQAHGRVHVLAMFADGGAEWRHLLALGCTARPSAEWHERRLNIRITGPYLTTDMLREHWRYSLGDSDLA